MGENSELQLETLLELCLQRKHSDYEELKKWDGERAKRLELHLKTAQQVVEYVDTSLKQSDQYLNAIRVFLDSKADQYRIYTDGTVTTPPLSCYDIQSVKGIEQSNSIGCKHQNTVAEVYRIIHYDLLEKVRGSLNATDLISRTREGIGVQMEELRDRVEEAQQKCSKLSSSYHKEKAEGNTFKCRIDLYARQEAFVCAAKRQTELQRKLGISVAKYLEEAIDFQISRHKVIKEVLCAYYKVLMLIDCTIPDGIMQTVSKQSSEELVGNQLYCPSNIIQENLHSQIKTIVVKQEHHDKPLRLAELKVYLSCLEFMEFSPRNLVLKETRVMLTMNEQMHASIVRLTIDGFLHFYIGKDQIQQNSHRSDLFVKVSKCKISYPSDANLKIQCNGQGHRKDKQRDYSVILLTFSGQDSKVEFSQFLDSVCNQ